MQRKEYKQDFTGYFRSKLAQMRARHEEDTVQ